MLKYAIEFTAFDVNGNEYCTGDVSCESTEPITEKEVISYLTSLFAEDPRAMEFHVNKIKELKK